MINEMVTARPFSGLKSHAIKVEQARDLRGGIEDKRIVQGYLDTDTEKKHPVSLIERGEQTSYYWNNWLAFKDAGLPVVPTVRLTPEGRVLVTNIKADGSEIYDKGMILVQKGVFEDESRKPHPLDTIFLELTDNNNLPKLQTEAEKIAQQATESNVLLPYDDPMNLVIHPDGSWELMILDLTKGRMASRYGDVSENEIQIYNLNHAAMFIRFLKEIRKNLEAQATQPSVAEKIRNKVTQLLTASVGK